MRLLGGGPSMTAMGIVS